MTKEEIREWAGNLAENDERVDWQKSDPVLGSDIAGIIREENPNATDSDIDQIARLINSI